jgi:hypothetical protein
MPQVLDEQLQNAMNKLNNKQKKAVLNIVNAFVEEDTVSDHWKDKSFVAEMDRRYNEYKSGKAKLVSLDDLEKKTRNSAAKIHAKRAS